MPNPDGTLEWGELLTEAQQRLRVAGIENWHQEARWIVEEVAGIEPGATAVLSDLVTERGIAKYDDMMARRCDGEPLQYVIGHWPFRTLDLLVDKRVLIPRPETEQLVDHVLIAIDRWGVDGAPVTVLDLGTGSGAIALSIAVERVHTQVWGVEASSEALSVARANTAGIGRPGTRVTILEGDWFDGLPDTLQGSFQVIVANPPYIATTANVPDQVTAWEPHDALFSGTDGLDAFHRILASIDQWSAAGAMFFCELGEENIFTARDLARERFGSGEVLCDAAGYPRFLTVEITSKVSPAVS